MLDIIIIIICSIILGAIAAPVIEWYAKAKKELDEDADIKIYIPKHDHITTDAADRVNHE